MVKKTPKPPKTTTPENCIHYEAHTLPRCCSQPHTLQLCHLDAEDEKPCDPRRAWCEYEENEE